MKLRIALLGEVIGQVIPFEVIILPQSHAGTHNSVVQKAQSTTFIFNSLVA